MLSNEEMRRIEQDARAALDDLVQELPARDADELFARLVAQIEIEIERDRSHWAEVCRGRAERWNRTIGNSDAAPAMARDECRARENEATWIADLIRHGGVNPVEEGLRRAKG